VLFTSGPTGWGLFVPAWFIRSSFGAWSVSDADAAKWKGPGLP